MAVLLNDDGLDGNARAVGHICRTDLKVAQWHGVAARTLGKQQELAAAVQFVHRQIDGTQKQVIADVASQTRTRTPQRVAHQ